MTCRDPGVTSRFRIEMRKRISVVVVLVFVNYAVFMIGARFNHPVCGISLDSLGAALCETTYFGGMILIPLSIGYCFLRRFALPIRQWDVYGPGLAIILNLAIHLLRGMHGYAPWYLRPFV